MAFAGSLLGNAHYGVRQLRLNPGFAAVSIISLALGIGANTAIFELLDAVRLRSLPVSDPHQLAEIVLAERSKLSGSFNGRRNQLTYPQWEQIRSHAEGFSSVMAWGDHRFNLSVSGESRYAQGLLVSGDYFRTLQVPAFMGRLLTNDDDKRGCGSPGAVISHGFWQKQFAGSATVVGQKLLLDGHPFEVTGVTPANFSGVEVGQNFDVAVPLCAQPMTADTSYLDRRNFWWLSSFGRLKPGWSTDRATAQLKAISPGVFESTLPPNYRADAAKNYRALRLKATEAGSGVSSLRGRYESPLLLLIGISALVLVIACANLANLMLARASAREREISIRLAVGASRGQIVSQLLVESLIIAIAGAVSGALLAQLLSRVLVSFLSTSQNDVFLDMGTDWRVLGFTAALAILTCILFGLAPAMKASRAAPADAMKSGRGQTAGREKFGLRRVLAASQVALSLMLLVSALLFVGSLRNLMESERGFRQDGVLVVDMDLTRAAMKADQLRLAHSQLLENLRSAPGVEVASSVAVVPISGSRWNNMVRIDGPKGAAKGELLTDFNRVSPEYFKAMGAPIIAGRDFTDRDNLSAPVVAIADEAFCSKFLDGANPVGLTLRLVADQGEADIPVQIVGLIKNMKYRSLREDFTPTLFLATGQEAHPGPNMTFVMRARIPFESLTAEVKRIANSAQPNSTLEFRILKTQIQETLVRERLMAILSGFFGALAVILATIGLYGVMSYMVARRQSEIGIRMALGANASGIAAMVLRDAGMVLAIGLAAGTVLTVAVTRLAASLIFGVKPDDPALIALAAAGLSAVVMAASFVPANRASRMDPMKSLRQE